MKNENWISFLVLPGFLFPMFLLGACIVANPITLTGEPNLGYIISHSWISWVVCGILFPIAIIISIRESKKEKEKGR